MKELERTFSNFLWKKKMHAWGWQDVCRPKLEGGVGIRRLIDVNNASGVRLVWRICTSNLLWGTTDEVTLLTECSYITS